MGTGDPWYKIAYQSSLWLYNIKYSVHRFFSLLIYRAQLLKSLGTTDIAHTKVFKKFHNLFKSCTVHSKSLNKKSVHTRLLSEYFKYFTKDILYKTHIIVFYLYLLLYKILQLAKTINKKLLNINWDRIFKKYVY